MTARQLLKGALTAVIFSSAADVLSYTEGMDILSELPVEMGQKVLGYLSPYDLVRASRVCRNWRSLVNCDALWRRHCRAHGWPSTDMVTDYRSHRYKRRGTSDDCSGLEPACEWWLNFQRHKTLPKNWERNRSIDYQISVVDSPVTSIDCDGTTLVVGHAQGVVTAFNILHLPQYCDTVSGVLTNYRVLRVKTNTQYVILLQSMLVQVFRFRSQIPGFLYVGGKSLELGPGNIELRQWEPPIGDEFQQWYKEAVGGDKFSKDWISLKGVFFEVVGGDLYVAVRDFRAVYVWALETCRRVDTVYLINPQAKIRDFVVRDARLYVTYASRNVRHVAVYDTTSGAWLYEVTTPHCKTQKVVCGERLLIGVGVAGPALVHNGLITVWDRSTGETVRSKPTSDYVSYRNVLCVYDLVVYSEGTVVRVWDPVTDAVLKQFSTDENVVHLKAGPYRFLIVYTHTTCHVWDWVSGVKLYRLHAQLQWMGDYSHLVWVDRTMILAKGPQNTVMMIGYC